MAGRARLLHLHEQAVLIAIDIDIEYALDIARGFTLDPVFLTRPAPEGNAQRRDRPLDGLPIHVSHHQDLAVVCILDYRRQQSVFIKFKVLWNEHALAFSFSDPLTVYIVPGEAGSLAVWRTQTPRSARNALISLIV